MERFKESGAVPASSQDIKDHFVEALTRECRGDTRVIGLSQNPAHHTLTRPPIGPFDWSFLADLQRKRPFHVVLWYRSNVVSRAIGLINEYRPGMEFCHRLKDPNSTQWKRIEEAGHHLRDCRKSKFAVAKERFLRSITWGLCEIAMYHRLADYVSDNKTHVMTYEDFVRDEDGGLRGLMAQLYPDRPTGRVEILATRKPSDIVKRSNSQVKKMVARRADIKSPRRRRAIGANRSFRAGDERGRGRGLVRRVGRAGAALAQGPVHKSKWRGAAPTFRTQACSMTTARRPSHPPMKRGRRPATTSSTSASGRWACRRV